MKQILVFSTVLITIMSSLILDFTAEGWQTLNFYVLVVVGAVFLINLFKFYLWGQIHRKYEVSASYPLTSIFFPIIYLIGYLQGEAQLSLYKILGVAMIMVGLIIFEKKRRVI